MEISENIKKLITDAKNICVIPSQTNEPESLSAALALFYTLKEMRKNVNVIIDALPQNLAFLSPSLDFISTPKNFVISIPRALADISQVYYEKSDENLKIHLTVDKGQIKKDNISFYFSDAKPDLVITLGIQDLHHALQGKLDSFGFILDTPIVNIDNSHNNKKFGTTNIIEETSLCEITLSLIKSFNENGIDKRATTCLLTGISLYYDNFQSPKATHQIFELSAQLMKNGADRQQIIENLYRPSAPEAIHFTKEKGQIINTA